MSRLRFNPSQIAMLQHIMTVHTDSLNESGSAEPLQYHHHNKVTETKTWTFTIYPALLLSGLIFLELFQLCVRLFLPFTLLPTWKTVSTPLLFLFYIAWYSTRARWDILVWTVLYVLVHYVYCVYECVVTLQIYYIYISWYFTVQTITSEHSIIYRVLSTMFFFTMIGIQVLFGLHVITDTRFYYQQISLLSICTMLLLVKKHLRNKITFQISAYDA